MYKSIVPYLAQNAKDGIAKVVVEKMAVAAGVTVNKDEPAWTLIGTPEQLLEMLRKYAGV